MNMVKSIRGWLQDRKRVSMQRHEIDYIKDVADKIIRETADVPPHVPYRLKAGTARKIALFIKKVKAEPRK